MLTSILLLALAPLAPAVAAASAAPGAPGAPQASAPDVVSAEPVKIQDNYGLQGGEETLFNVTYPPGKGPPTQGYPQELLPVVITLRGGNNNAVVAGAPETGSVSIQAIEYGVVGIEPNFPTVEQGEDYTVSTAGVARLIQYLRANATLYNIDPARIFLLGRSFGQVVCLSVSWKQDFQDLGSSDPVEWESSRPDFTIARQGPAALHCMSEDTNGWHSSMSLFFFKDSNFKNSTTEERIADSSFWWLTNPQLFGRDRTPPLCIVYRYNHFDVCGEVTDVHSGLFGDILVNGVRDYSRFSGDRRILETLGSIDNGAQNETITITRILLWVAQRLADDFDGLHLVPPVGTVDGTTGSTLLLNVLGGTPGSEVTLYTGVAEASQPVAGCPDIEQRILNPVPLGIATVGAGGLASFNFFVPPGQIGQAALFQVIGSSTCEASNLISHTYLATEQLP